MSEEGILDSRLAVLTGELEQKTKRIEALR
jgi:hypothetical protein